MRRLDGAFSFPPLHGYDIHTSPTTRRVSLLSPERTRERERVGRGRRGMFGSRRGSAIMLGGGDAIGSTLGRLHSRAALSQPSPSPLRGGRGGRRRVV